MPVYSRIQCDRKTFRRNTGIGKKYPDILGIEILPYHNFGKSKASNIGEEYEIEIKMPVDEEIERWMNKFKEIGSKKVFRKK